MNLNLKVFNYTFWSEIISINNKDSTKNYLRG